jgi:hypothetical protein
MSAMTQAEAHQTHCCVEGCGSIEDDGRRYCETTMCMGWRWCEVLVKGPDSYISEPGPKGYCGLAGLPLELQ